MSGARGQGMQHHVLQCIFIVHSLKIKIIKFISISIKLIKIISKLTILKLKLKLKLRLVCRKATNTQLPCEQFRKG